MPDAIQLLFESSTALSTEEPEWVAIRARGAEWSWLTPAEAAELGRQWVERYGSGVAPTQLVAAE